MFKDKKTYFVLLLSENARSETKAKEGSDLTWKYFRQFTIS